ncbi:MAG: ArsR family transcriptional regulator [Dehalococcoidia bacterium]|nr:ArsR family transcriptional regulator [Dehalococcoidia bacterium]
MERTRDQVVAILHEHGSRTVSELAEEIGVSQGAIRRHLDIMVADDLLDTALERQRRGRPATRYSLSEAGEERSSHSSYSRLLDRLFPAMARLPQEDVDGRAGADVLQRVFEEMARGVADEYAPRVRGGELGDRIQQVTEALRDEGILQEASDEGAVFRLRNAGCPYRSAAEGTHMACMADRRAIELLLDAPVEQVTTIVDGAACCEYVVAK